MILAALLLAIHVTDDTGRVRSTDDWKGVPTIVAPMYARCPLACPLIAEGLKRGVNESKATPGTYRVVLFSFDPRDTPRDLQLFRERHRIPLSWSIVKANDSADAHRFLDALDYHYADAKGLFAHPNEVIVLDRAMKPAKVMAGTNYDIDAALAIARGRRDWIGQFGGQILAGLILVSVFAAIRMFTTSP